MRKNVIAALAAAWACLFLPISAGGQTMCGSREIVAASLRQVFDEHRRIEAVTTAGTLLEVFVADPGSWTILVTVPGGPSCPIAAGEGWQALPPPASGI